MLVARRSGESPLGSVAKLVLWLKDQAVSNRRFAAIIIIEA
jgi:hypothetical protein